MVYYDLAPFSSELESLSSGIKTLHQLCPEIKHQSMCEVLTNNLDQIRDNKRRRYLQYIEQKEQHSTLSEI